MCIYYSQTPNLPSSPFAFGNHVCFVHLSVHLVNKFICVMFWIPHVRESIECVLLCLTDFTEYDHLSMGTEVVSMTWLFIVLL